MRRDFTLLLGLAVTAGCHRSPVVAAAAPQPAEDLAARTRADSLRAAERARADSLAEARRAAEEADRLRRLAAALRDTLGMRTYFDFDRADLRADARPVLDWKLAILRANPGLTIRIAGHADERGSDEYNLALGARRAATARRYLVDHGVRADRLEVVSYGEEQPRRLGHDEASWAENRRDEFTPVVGADSLLAPVASR